jgi:hypothetical protein
LEKYAIPTFLGLVYSSVLTSHRPKYCQWGNCVTPDYFYELIDMTVAIDGYFQIASDSVMDTVGYLYSGSFDPSHPDINMISCDHEGGGNYQFMIVVYLEGMKNYTLLITTFYPNETGAHSITVTGTSAVAILAGNLSRK